MIGTFRQLAPASGFLRFVRDRHALISALIILSATAIGLWLRWLARDHTNSDVFGYLLPWFEQVKRAGADSLGREITNYAPFYTYLLLLATKLDGLLSPLYLIKAISFVFEFGCAVLASRLVATGTQAPIRPAFAYAAVWLAPNAFYNGAMWAQSDAIWTFFILLSVYLICHRSHTWAIVAFSMAMCVKLQAIFLGPLIFALAQRQRLHWSWVGVIPAIYLVVALPALALGRPLLDVLTIYLQQVATFRAISKGAANLWLFLPNEFYAAGVVIGLVLAAAAGLAFSAAAARQRDWSPHFVILAAVVTLQLMPWILPKMHERYFYAFETSAIILAFIEPRLALVAIVAQVNAVLAYLHFDIGTVLASLGAPLAALLNTVMLAFMIRRFLAGTFHPFIFTVSVAFVTIAYVVWLTIILTTIDSGERMLWWPLLNTDVAGFAMFAGIFILLAAGMVIGARSYIRARRGFGP